MKKTSAEQKKAFKALLDAYGKATASKNHVEAIALYQDLLGLFVVAAERQCSEVK